ncbi:hypothetical protein EKO27_g10123 [Xylaria grammica]|uniref:Cytochrome P450 n=1 Tax=Xylaria grammica TaxID=363999 RepID=A0A439CS52_9PEZI|nr:hypothetical protein EKO27_g10123 [Xylaria grammica]
MLDRIVALAMRMHLLVYWPCVILYRLYFHPLAGYPGSKFAAISTSSWEFYWNYYHNGRMLFEIERLHKVYGPVIRIGVNDLHVSDPEVYQDLTRINSGFTKDVGFYLTISLPGTSIGETNPEKHRVRRKVLSPALSGTRVQELAPAVLRKAKELLSRFESASDTSSPVCVTSAAKAFTMDIISKIVLGQELGCVADPSFRNELTKHLNAVFRMGWTATAFPRLSALALQILSMTSVLPFPVPLASLKRSCLSITKEYLDIFNPKHVARGTAARIGGRNTNNNSRSAVIDVLMDPTNVESHNVPSLDELNDEILMLLIAGNDTTSNAVIFAIYQIATHSTVRQRLFKELKEALPSLGEKGWITYDQAKRLPYLV